MATLSWRHSPGGESAHPKIGAMLTSIFYSVNRRFMNVYWPFPLVSEPTGVTGIPLGGTS